jgi:hypothetical protein
MTQDDLKDPNRAVDYVIANAGKFAQAKAQRVYLAIPGWPEYEINQDGLIRRVAAATGTSVGRMLKWQALANGYAKVALCRNAKRREFLVHRLVALTFLGDPEGMDVCHHDGNKLNNAVENLRIDNRTGNMADQIRMDKTPRGERSGSNKYTAKEIKAIRDRLHAGESVPAISAETGIPKSTLYGLRSGQTWGWL